MNKELMEKIAAVKWKREFANLSKDEQQKILSNTDYERYVSGLEKGNDQLLKRLGAVVIHEGDKKQFKKVYNHNLYDKDAMWNKIRAARGIGDRKQNLAEKLEAMFFYRVYIPRERRKLQRWFSSPGTITSPQPVKHPVIYNISKDKDKLTKFGQGIVRMCLGDKKSNQLSNLDIRAINALTMRHELDEIRAGLKVKEPSRYSTGHNSPEVIHRESANAAFMPPLVRELKNKTRTLYGDEAEDLKKNTGIVYASSPYFDKKKSRTHVKNWLKEVNNK